MRSNLSYEDAQSKKVHNVTLLIGLIIQIPFLILFQFMHWHYINLILAIGCLTIIGSFYFSYHSKNHIALIVTFLYYTTGIALIGFLLNGRVGSEYSLLSLSLIPLFAVRNSPKIIFSLYSYLGLACIIYIVGDLESYGIYHVSDTEAFITRVFCLFQCLILSISQLYFYASENVRIRNKIIQQHQTLINSSKLSDLGVMAAGIAHEINNPLTVIKGKATLLERMINDSKQNKTLQSIIENCDRIVQIIRGLKVVARDGSNDDFEDESLQSIINDVISFTKNKLTINQVNLKLDIPTEIPIIHCRSVQISQIIVNLFVNSIDAIEDHDSKWIEIKVFQKEDNVYIHFIDSGNGIPENIVKNMFNPFYTTKGVDKGTGLGLSISSSIMQDHGGHLKYLTDKKNTTFEISLPIKGDKSQKSA